MSLSKFLDPYYKNNGWIFVGTGIFHCGVGILQTYQYIKPWFTNYLWNTVQIDTQSLSTMNSAAAFWFISAGVAWMIYGYLIQLYKKHTRKPLPKAINIAFLLYSVPQFILMPESGFILLVIQGILNLWDRYVPTKQEKFQVELQEEQQ